MLLHILGIVAHILELYDKLCSILIVLLLPDPIAIVCSNTDCKSAMERSVKLGRKDLAPGPLAPFAQHWAVQVSLHSWLRAEVQDMKRKGSSP